MATQNQTLLGLYKSLCAQQDAVSAAISKTTDPNVADTLSTENYEIMHRIVLVQNLLFQADSQQLQADVKSATDAAAQLQKAIANINTVSSIVQSVSNYLGLVDEAIDLAKTLAA